MQEPISVERASQILAHVTSHRREQTTLQIEVFQPGSVGGTPRVPVVAMQAGFDWDNGAMLLKPKQALSTLNQDQIAAIAESASKGQSWHAYQAQNKLHERIRALEAEIAALKQGGA